MMKNQRDALYASGADESPNREIHYQSNVDDSALFNSDEFATDGNTGVNDHESPALSQLNNGDEIDTEPLDTMHLWEGDTGTMPHDARSALLRLIKGPYISESNDPIYWRALLNHAETIRSRLADLFLELIIDAEAGVAFSKNVFVDGKDFPKAATSYTLTLLDTIMVLLLRKELQTAGNARVFIGQTDLFMQMNQYRNIAKLDQAAYLKRLEASWSRLEKQHLLVKSDVEGRYEISPVLKLVFGAEEAQAVFDEYERMRDELSAKAQTEDDLINASTEEGTLFDGLL